MERTVGTGSPWRPSPDLKYMILLHELLPEPWGQALVHVGKFMVILSIGPTFCPTIESLRILPRQ